MMSRFVAAIACVLTTAVSAQTLPGGASQLQETHGDWRVTCAQQSAARVCTLSQQQSDRDTRQLLVGIELQAVAADRLEGSLVLPFGLAVNRPVTLQVDDGAAVPLPFRTCLPVGCVVKLTFEPAMVAAMRRGAVLVAKATTDSAQEMPFRISLQGLGSAADRAVALAQ